VDRSHARSSSVGGITASLLIQINLFKDTRVEWLQKSCHNCFDVEDVRGGC